MLLHSLCLLSYYGSVLPATAVQVGAAIDEEEMTELFHLSDMSGQGMIDYEEFIAAMLDSHRVAQRNDAVRKSFEQLDRDGDGYISVQDLAEVSCQPGNTSQCGSCCTCTCFCMCSPQPNNHRVPEKTSSIP